MAGIADEMARKRKLTQATCRIKGIEYNLCIEPIFQL
ncbi:hypothetical protein H310_15043 [Aphanomyces invadans]|uniref:Uncharacterized protein n=1 Tax=Aphanomyces invadans TaxID=157072 RepID=A0A024T835_9STRA|nr:hypothetical protein H310_15043 [Aphanomyces invadans]ETV90128.1 hypothetical protein H310_15043 [Aphanomyces invadans]|eukprot:XP_008881243.1 hypothetical protein H310_15043 [Aphanomyces invadans]